jgi:hypothetical protein
MTITEGVLMEGYEMVNPEWVKYPDDYEKEFCDIKTKSGEEFGPCWPNAGKFNVLVNGPSTVMIDEDDVTHIRYYE